MWSCWWAMYQNTYRALPSPICDLINYWLQSLCQLKTFWVMRVYIHTLRFTPDTQHGSSTPIALAKAKFSSRTVGEKKKHAISLFGSQITSYFCFCKNKHFLMYISAIAWHHCVQEPLKGFISLDNTSEKVSGIAASLLFTIKGTCCIKGVWFIQNKISQQWSLKELKHTRSTLEKATENSKQAHCMCSLFLAVPCLQRIYQIKIYSYS